MCAKIISSSFPRLSGGALEAMHQSTPSPVSSANSSQDSLHRHTQKKRNSLRSSFGRLFHKKDRNGATAAKMKGPQDQSGFQSASDSESFVQDGTLTISDSGKGRLPSTDYDRRRKQK